MSTSPTGWSQCKFEELARGAGAIAYGVLKPGIHTPDGVPMIRVTDIRRELIDLSNVYLISRELDEEFRRTRLEGGELLISIQGTVGRVALAPPTCSGANVSRTIAVVRLASPAIGRWLRFTLLSPQGQALMRSRVGGSTRDSLNLGDLRDIDVPIPPKQEQARIVTKLDAIFAQTRAAKARLERLPALLEKLKRSILAAAFRGDLTADWRAAHPDVEPASVLLDRIRTERRLRWEATLRAKGKDPAKATYDEPLPLNNEDSTTLPSGWAWATLGGLCEIASGQTPAGIESALHPGRDLPWFRVGDMNLPANRVQMADAPNTLAIHDVQRLGIHTRPAGTVIFPKRGGAIATNKKRLLDRPGAYDLNIMGLIAPDSIARYFRLWFETIDLASLNNGSTIPQINNGDVEPLLIPLAPIIEQAAIVSALDDALRQIDSLLLQIGPQLSRVVELEQAALAKAFRGELVPQDPDDEPAAALLERIRATRATEVAPPRRGRKATATPYTPPAPSLAQAAEAGALFQHAHDRQQRSASPEPPTLDLVIAALQQGDTRLSAAAITTATGVDAAAVKQALKALVAAGQVRVHGKARGTTYEWIA